MLLTTKKERKMIYDISTITFEDFAVLSFLWGEQYERENPWSKNKTIDERRFERAKRHGINTSCIKMANSGDLVISEAAIARYNELKAKEYAEGLLFE